ncbi:hypothetical protein [Wenyingzhuangia marina]|uniref:Outer membrane protein beta-barrel domain-containing protein n=1 Tax=Wenyingzhuangia marina TaxID=1195760 RepID=A0A1M5UB84_9FLAO|nr:hypothetical protein [Wenyingzhuangia marina]GGF68631.1 hypothetical protein GCM10011397_09520 [Wenyingzhuangia marina]SHH60168.1 hypothetical protein SAMN05444281_1142 [Wenyingzhuangia marina]
MEYLNIRLLIFFVLFYVTGLTVAQNKGIVQVLFDPKMMVEGPYVDSDSGELDLIIRIGASKKTYEIGVFAEQFQALRYSSAGIYVNRIVNIHKIFPTLKQFELTAGLDTGFVHRIISNQKNYSFTAALNTEVKFYVREKYGVSVLPNYRYRGDLAYTYKNKRPMRFSVFIGLFYNF